MVGRLKLASITIVAVGLVFGQVASLQAQEAGGRFRVLIPYFEPLEGADDDFGKDASKELRELINTLATHQPIEEKEIKRNLKRFDLDMDELDCIRTRQLATQIDAQVALCASYSTDANDVSTVHAVFWDIASAESFEVESTTVGKDEEAAAAQHIFGQFDEYVQQIRFAAFCGEYAASQQWDNALRNCDQALELNPTAVSTRYQRARILYDSERYPESLEELGRVLGLDPYHQDALQLAGYISAIEGDDEAARNYYSQYLELNPANAAVRMSIAYDLAQAGDPVGAMQLIQVGLDVDPENTDLWEQYGGFAFAAAIEAEQLAAVGAENGGGVPPEALEFYSRAIDAYNRVFEAKGAETPVGHLRQIISAHIKLDDLGEAIAMAERTLETHAQEDVIWSIYADALQRADRLDEAITALDRVREINPAYPNVALRQGSWLIQAGRVQDAVEILKGAAAGNPEQAEQAARLIFADAYGNGYQQDRYQYAIAGFRAAKELPEISQSMRNQLNFWHAFSLYQSAVRAQEPQTLETANRTLPMFQEAMGLFQNSGDYPASVNVNIQQLMDNTNTYVEIQDAIIKRGR
jgi:tetratricopeptide (TPR) repeat protein